jgi:hypothetical protein
MAENVIEDKKERQRSPNYPAVGLREAVERVRKLFAADGRAGAPAEIAAKHIGYSSAHGQAMSVIAALKRFGLVAEVSGRLAPTQAAIEILNLPETDSRRRTALREAALNPPLYRELVEGHRATGLPQHDVLEAELTTYKKFNPKAVEGFVRDFLDTLEYAGINVSDDVKSSEVEEPMNEPTISSEPESTSKAGFSFMKTAYQDAQKAQAAQALQNAWTWTLSIPRNVRAELRVSGPVTKADIIRLRKQVDALEESFDEEE